MRDPAAPIRTLIVDDEPLAREGLRILLGGERDVELIGECASGREAIDAIRRERPDLVFLDVQMPELDGFGVIAELDRDEVPAAVVFVTAYDRYALRAFDVQALDYLLKPFDDERFHDALRRVRRQLGLPASRGFATRLAVRDLGRIVFLNVAEIDWIEAADYYVQLHAGSRSWLHRESMQRLEARLDPSQFLRIHRSAIINVRSVKEIRHERRRDLVVVLGCGATLKVARSHREKLQRLL